MPQPDLGSLETVDIRQVWIQEERDFTPWLAQNIDRLSDLLGIPITVEQTEKLVGRYELDILARTHDDRVVVIENQLEATDHSHLGQLLTYAAGLDAAVIVWPAPYVTDEHRDAVEWLNRKRVDDLSFFLVRPEVFSIDGSRPAVRLNLEAAPSQSIRQLRRVTQPGENASREFFTGIWPVLCPYLAERGHSWALRGSGCTGNFISSTVGRTGVEVGVDYEAEVLTDTSPDRDTLFAWIALDLTRLRKIAARYLSGQ